jgi:hypothetical protein
VRFLLRFRTSLVVAALVAAGPAAAGETPKVWTNEDLERLFGPSEASGPVAVDPERASRDQAFVEQFLERHYRLLEADKERDLRREEARTVAAEEPEYSLAYAPWAGGWWWPRERPGRPGGRPAYRGDPPYRYARDVNPAGDGVRRSAAAVNPTNRR